jgi:hypothetical protein
MATAGYSALADSPANTEIELLQQLLTSCFDDVDVSLSLSFSFRFTALRCAASSFRIIARLSRAILVLSYRVFH